MRRYSIAEDLRTLGACDRMVQIARRRGEDAVAVAAAAFGADVDWLAGFASLGVENRCDRGFDLVRVAYSDSAVSTLDYLDYPYDCRDAALTAIGDGDCLRGVRRLRLALRKAAAKARRERP